MEVYSVKGISPFGYLSILIFCKCIILVCSLPKNGQEYRLNNCQWESTSGRDYVGRTNTTVDGIPCQIWSHTHPHDHIFTHVGKHNFCRNPDGALQSQVWCYTTDPDRERQNCSVPFCPPLKAIDVSLDNDHKQDEQNSYTHASLQKENFPSSFAICTAFMLVLLTAIEYFREEEKEGEEVEKIVEHQGSPIAKENPPVDKGADLTEEKPKPEEAWVPMNTEPAQNDIMHKLLTVGMCIDCCMICSKKIQFLIYILQRGRRCPWWCLRPS